MKLRYLVFSCIVSAAFLASCSGSDPMRAPGAAGTPVRQSPSPKQPATIKISGVRHIGREIFFDPPIDINWKAVAEANGRVIVPADLSSGDIQTLRENRWLDIAELPFPAPAPTEMFDWNYYFLTSSGLYELTDHGGLRLQGYVRYHLDNKTDLPLTLNLFRGDARFPVPEAAGKPEGGVMVITRAPWEYQVTKLANTDDGSGPMLLVNVVGSELHWILRDASGASWTIEVRIVHSGEKLEQGLQDYGRAFMVSSAQHDAPFVFIARNPWYEEHCVAYSYSLYKAFENRAKWLAGSGYGCVDP